MQTSSLFLAAPITNAGIQRFLFSVSGAPVVTLVRNTFSHAARDTGGPEPHPEGVGATSLSWRTPIPTGSVEKRPAQLKVLHSWADQAAGDNPFRAHSSVEQDSH